MFSTSKTPNTIDSLHGIFLANHNQDTGIRFWDLERWKQEIADAKRMGANAVCYLPIQFGQRTPKDFADGAPHWTLQCAVSRAIREAGLRVGIYVGLNDVFHETWLANPNWQSPNGPYFLEEAHVCPQIPEAWSEVLRLRERLFSTLPHVDFLVTPATDYGGCGCERCAPWPRAYLKRLEEMSALLRRHHPDALVIAAGHGLPIRELDLLRGELLDCGWADAVADIPRGAGKPVVKYYMFPETTMAGFWGKFGMQPLLPTIVRLWQEEGRELPVVQYSEGIHDDINRYAVLRIARDRTLTAQAIARDYGVEWLGLPADEAEVFAGNILKMGHLDWQPRSHPYLDYRHGWFDQESDSRTAYLSGLRKLFPHLENESRYWLLMFHAVAESMSTAEGPLAPEELCEEAEACRRAFRRLDPAYARFVDGLSTFFQPGGQPWVWPRTAAAAWRRERSFPAVKSDVS